MGTKASRTYISLAVIALSAGSVSIQAAFLGGCGDPSTSQEVASAAPSALATAQAPPSVGASASAPATASAGPGAGRGDGSGGGKRFGDAVAYVDGRPVAVLRFFEMPPSLRSHPHALLDGRTVPRYRLAEYVEALGYPLSKVKEVHLTGGRNRTSVLTRAELEKHRSDLNFSFSREIAGKPRVHWPASGIEVNTTIDVITAIAIYVDKEPPRFDPKSRKMMLPSGEALKGVAYTKPEDAPRGTRVYFDGKLAGTVKRKHLPDSVLSPRYTPSKPRFSLEKYLASIGVDPARVKQLTVVERDHVVLRLDEQAWKKASKEAEFSLAQGSEGRIIVHTTEGGAERSFDATSLLAFDKSPVPERVASAPVEPGGSKTDQPDVTEQPE